MPATPSQTLNPKPIERGFFSDEDLPNNKMEGGGKGRPGQVDDPLGLGPHSKGLGFSHSSCFRRGLWGGSFGPAAQPGWLATEPEMQETYQ